MVAAVTTTTQTQKKETQRQKNIDRQTNGRDNYLPCQEKKACADSNKVKIQGGKQTHTFEHTHINALLCNVSPVN